MRAGRAADALQLLPVVIGSVARRATVTPAPPTTLVKGEGPQAHDLRAQALGHA